MLNTKDLISYVVLPRTVKDLLDRLESGRLSDIGCYASNSNENFLNSSSNKAESDIRNSTISTQNQWKFPYVNKHNAGSIPKAVGELRGKEINNFKHACQHSHHSHSKEFHCSNTIRENAKRSHTPFGDFLNQNVNSYYSCHNSLSQPELSKDYCIPCDNKPNEYGNQKMSDGVHANNHLNIPPQNEPEKCVSCGKCFSNKLLLIEHYLTHSLSECTVCGKTCTDKWKLKRHLNTHVREKPIKGNSSSRTPPKEQDLITEKKSSTNEGPFECRECKRIFSEKINFKNHLARHIKKNCHTFSSPGKTFSVKSYHINQFNIYQVHRCKICSKTFPDKWKLQRHFEAHTGKKLHACKMCNKKFFYKWQLTRHLPSHTVENPAVVENSAENVG